LKHISVVRCISASDDHTTPLLVSSQVTSVIRKLKIQRPESALISHLKPDKPYLNAILFNEYVSTVLLPHITRLGSNPGLENRPAVPLTDTCSVHTHDKIGCPLMLDPNMLAIVQFSSKINLRYLRKRSHHFHQSSVAVDSSSR
jgi:hypothetical protein